MTGHRESDLLEPPHIGALIGGGPERPSTGCPSDAEAGIEHASVTNPSNCDGKCKLACKSE